MALIATTAPTLFEGQSAKRDSVDNLRVAKEATARFLATWRTEWLTSDWEASKEFRRVPGAQVSWQLMGPAQREHFRCTQYALPFGEIDPTRSKNRIGSVTPWRSPVCPSWTDDLPMFSDASSVLDSALAPNRRVQMATARDSLLAKLSLAAATHPGDEWITGQRVRFLLDQSCASSAYAAKALSVARECRASLWFCESLVGFVYARRHSIDSAQAAFDRARVAGGASLRCGLSDVMGLMDRTAVPREFVPPPTCVARLALADRFWWLADPLWSDDINERRVEHEARTVAVLLASALPRSERFDWSVSEGGDAVVQLVTRYGWPSRMVASAIAQSRMIGTPPNLQTVRFRPGIDPFDEAPSPPATTQEYAFDRVHLAPSWTALIDPFSARPSDWQFSAPADESWRRWWPSEHMHRDRELLAITEWQDQQWQRQDSIVVAMATRVPRAMSAGRSFSSDIDAWLMRSRGPSLAVSVARRTVRSDKVMYLSGTRPADSTLLSLELYGSGTLTRDARVRFAPTALPPLRAMPAGTLALSTPALLNVDSATTLVSNADSAASRLLPSTIVRATRRVGLFWESYGLADTTAVDISVQVHRTDSPGRFERIAASLGLRDRELTGTEIRWREPQPGVRLVAGEGVAIHGRSVLLNLEGLRAGQYVVAVTVRALDGRTASSVRHFTLE